MRRILMLFICGLILSSCVKEIIIKNEIEEGKEFLMSFGLSASSQIAGKSAAVDEDTIEEIDILVFENGFYRYYVQGLSLKAVSGGYNFEARLTSSRSPVKLIILANSRNDVQTHLPDLNDPESVAKKKLTQAFTTAGFSGNTPMAGEYTFEYGLEATSLNRVEGLKMVRSIAKVNVIVSDEAAADFTLNYLRVFRANNAIQLAPDKVSNGRVDKASLPSGVAPSIHLPAVSVASGVRSVSDIFLPEAAYYTTDEDLINKTTCIVVGGIFEGKTRYYRVDFKNRNGQHRGELLRNHNYTINILEVSGEGWSTPEEAADNLSTEISTQIIEWEEDETNIIFVIDGSYFALSSRDVDLHFYENSTKGVKTDSDIPEWTIQFADENGDPVDNNTATWGETIFNDDFKVRITERGDSIIATALKTNESDQYKYQKLYVSAGRIRFNMTIRQGTREMRDYIHIFNQLQSYGNIGDEVMDHTTTAADPWGTPLRALIKNENHFGTNGTVPFAGYYISGLHPQTPITKYLIDLFDVIYVPSNNGAIFDDVECQLMRQWVEDGPNKAMVIQTDLNFNVNILSNFGVQVQTASLISSNPFKISDRCPVSIKNGPFGTLPENYPIYSAGTAGFINMENHTWLTPILVVAGNEKMALVSIDLKRGIVFHGNYYMYAPTSMSGAMSGGGNINNNYDRLIANIWAWIAEYVLGDDRDTNI